MRDKEKSKEIVSEPKKAFHEKQEPIRLKLRRVKIKNIDDKFKSIYKIKN